MHRLALILLLACAGAHAQTYRWTDPAGRTVISDAPPPSTAKNLSASTPAEPGAGMSYATRRAMENFPVTLYTAPNCQSECSQARDLLKQRGVPHTEKSLQSEADVAELKALSGDASVPVLKVGRQHFRGYAAAPWHDLLDLAGYPKSAAGGSRP